MKKTSVAILGALALLCASASMAASVQLIPTPNGVCCSASMLPGQSFVLTANVIGMPGNGSTTGLTGGSFTLNFDSTKVTITGVMLPGVATVPATATPPANTPSNPFDFITPLSVIDADHVAFSVLRNGTGCAVGFTCPVPFNYASGNFTAFKITGTVTVLSLVGFGSTDIVLVDDGADNSWTMQDANPVTGVNYTAATLVFPIPAAVWLLGSALGVLGVARRRAAG